MFKSRISTKNAYLNTCIVIKHIYFQYLISHKVNSNEIEVLLSLDKITSGNLGDCTIKDLRVLLTGKSHWRAYIIINSLISKGYITNSGNNALKSKKKLNLSPEGIELTRLIYSSITERISYLNDKLKMRAYIKRSKK